MFILNLIWGKHEKGELFILGKLDSSNFSSIRFDDAHPGLDDVQPLLVGRVEPGQAGPEVAVQVRVVAVPVPPASLFTKSFG